MKIAFLTTEYITEKEFAGGLANYLYRIVHALRQQNHEIEIFTLSHTDNFLNHEGIPVHQVRERYTVVFEVFNRLTRYRLKRTFRFLSLSYCLYYRFVKRYKKSPFDIIQASSCFACGLFSGLLVPLPLVVRVSSFEPLFRKHYHRPLSLDQRICEWLESVVIKRSDAAYAPSRFLSDILRKKGMKVDVFPSPFKAEMKDVDETIYQNELVGKKYFLFFGAIGFLKGCAVLAKSIPAILSDHPDVHFVFAGKNMEGPGGMPMMDYIYHKAGSFKARVIYLGVLPHSQLFPVISHAYSVLLPSLVDNFPNTMLEAMSLGKIVIGTWGTSFEELIEPHVSGFMVKPGDDIELTHMMEVVLRLTEDKKKAVEKAAQSQASRLAPDELCGELEEYFNSVIKQFKADA